MSAVSVASAFVATVTVAGADQMALELSSARLSHWLSETLGSFRGTGPSLEELDAISRRARLVRNAAYGTSALFVVTAAASLWIRRGEVRSLPWLSAAYYAGALGVLYASLRWLGPLWLLPVVAGAVLVAASAFELFRQGKRRGRTSPVAWAALVAAAFAVVVSVVGVR